MIVRIFSTNRIFILAFIPLLLAVLRFPSAMHDIQPSFEGLLPRIAEVFLYLSTRPVLSLIISLSLICVQAYYLARISDEQRLFDRTSNLPAFLLALNYSVFPEFHVLSPAMVANVFLVMALQRILQIYNQGDITGLVFRSGLYIGLASVFFKPSAAMYILLVYQLNIFRTVNWREMVIPLLSFFIPLFYLMSWYYLRDDMQVFTNWISVRSDYIDYTPFNNWAWPAFAVFLLLTIASFMHLLVTGSKRTIRLNNLYKVLTALCLITLLSLLTAPPDFYSTILLAMPAFSMIQSYFMLSLRKNWVREGVGYAFFIFIIGREIILLL